MTLNSSFTRAVLKLFIAFVFVTIVAALVEHARTGRWWTEFYFISLLLPCAVFIAFVCLVLCPSRLTLTEDALRIDRPVLPDIIIPLEDLRYYLKGPNTFMLQMRDQSSAYQICWYGFRRKEWRAFQAEIRRRFPERKAWFFVGARLVGRRQT